MVMSIEGIQKKIDELTLQAGLPRHSVNLCAAPVGDGAPYVTFENDVYNFIHSERGYEFSRKVTGSLDELLYWIMSELAYKVAFQYELEHRVKGRDGRRIVFPKFIDLMANMNVLWGPKAQREIKKILAEAPYDDSIYT